MNQYNTQETLAQIFPNERRKSDRSMEIQLLVVTNRGTGKILDIGSDGLSFGCLYHHAFPAIWTIDILNARGMYLKQLPVRKIWERTYGHPDLSAGFELEVGVEFMDLTSSQVNDLDILLLWG